jgi:RNA polymerase sigma factor (sigma-70 family)
MIPEQADMSAGSSDDAELAEDLLLAEQIASLYPGMLRFARTVVPPALAEDVVQETWIAVVNANTFEGRSTLRTWIYAVLRNKARQALGSEIRRRTVETEEATDECDPLAGRLHPCSKRWTNCHRGSGAWCFYMMSRVSVPRRCAISSISTRAISAFCCTVAERSSAPTSSVTSSGVDVLTMNQGVRCEDR